ncbi:MAG: methylornithine synthase PylB [Bacillota bacterium]|nr:methylornithine synthase PylB [Bacillota bacterium]
MMEVRNASPDVDHILAGAIGGERLTGDEILCLLNLQKRRDLENLFEAAREVRKKHFGDRIFLYGFIYFSTYCRNDCTFCFYRCSNKVSERYRKTTAEILDTAGKLAESGVHLLDLTMGEDPQYFTDGRFAGLLETVAAVKKSTGMPLMISPGVIPEEVLLAFCQMGVEWYACYQETHNRELYARLRLEQSYEERMQRKKYAREIGFLVEEGLLSGIGETAEDLLASFEVMAMLQADQVRVMSFIPQKGTPLGNIETGSHLREMLIIAVMRLLFPDRLIPGSLDVDGIAGLKERLQAGANVVTSIIPPRKGFLGVSQSTLDVDEGTRTVAGVVPVLEECGLVPAGIEDYRRWMAETLMKRHCPENIPGSNN